MSGQQSLLADPARKQKKSTTLRSHTCSVYVHRRVSVLRVRHWCT